MNLQNKNKNVKLKVLGQTDNRLALNPLNEKKKEEIKTFP